MLALETSTTTSRTKMNCSAGGLSSFPCLGSHAAGRSRYKERGHYDDAVGRISESLHRRICFVDRQVSCTDGNPAVPRTRFFVGTFFHRGNPKVLILL